jgi:hypothetical protein
MFRIKLFLPNKSGEETPVRPAYNGPPDNLSEPFDSKTFF